MRGWVPVAHHEWMAWEPFEVDPKLNTLEAVIEINAKLADIRRDVSEIRALLEEDDGEEEED